MYAHGSEEHGDNCGFKKHYDTGKGLQVFAATIQNLAETHPVLICWDAPLTMPHENGRFYIRRIEEIWRSNKLRHIKEANGDAASWASVQGFAGCSHWAITQRVLGYPSLNNHPLAEAKLENPTLVYGQPDKPSHIENGIRIIEVHPALAIQVAIGSEEVAHFGRGGKLSGAGSYKKVSWTKFDKAKKNNVTDGFTKLLENVKKEFMVTTGDVDFLPDRSGTGDKTKPSDHLDAWVAMQLGRMWLDDKAKIYGNERLGSFLLKRSENSRIESEIIATIDEQIIQL